MTSFAAKMKFEGLTWRVQFVVFSLDFEHSRVPLFVPSQLGLNAPGVTLLATSAAS
jgi:hypothetical protein